MSEPFSNAQLKFGPEREDPNIFGDTIVGEMHGHMSRAI